MSACYTCVCHEAYKNRGMIDPGCQAHDECPQYERLMARIADLERYVNNYSLSVVRMAVRIAALEAALRKFMDLTSHGAYVPGMIAARNEAHRLLTKVANE